MTDIPCPLGEAARRRPAAPFLVTPAREYSYAEANRAVNRRAAALARLETRLGPLRRLALLVPKAGDEPSLDVIITFLAAGRAGATALVVDGALPAPLVRAALPAEQGIVAVVAQDRREHIPFAAATWEEVAEIEAQILLSPAEADRTDFRRNLRLEATGVLTSGSTGTPKLCLHTVGNHYYSALGSNENLPLAEGDRWLLSLPLHHVGGIAILYRAMLAGAAVVPGRRPANPAESIETLGVTHCSMVPTQLRRYLAEGGHRAGLKAVLIGGAAAPRGLIEAAAARGLPLFTSYGLTEMCSQVTTTAPDDPLRRLFGSGRLLPFRELRIDESGEILVRGPVLSPGYLESNGLRTIADAEGWFHTGDRGELEPDGYLRVTGRKDHMLISGGENVQPELVEKMLLELPDVAEAVVVAVEDAQYGQRPFAFVSFVPKDPRTYDGTTRLLRDYVLLAGGRADTPAQVREMFRERLPAYAVPVRVALIPEEARAGLKPDRKYLERVAQALYGQAGEKTAG